MEPDTPSMSPEELKKYTRIIFYGGNHGALTRDVLNLAQKMLKFYFMLHFAAAEGNTQAVSDLIDAGADINQQDRDGCTPLFLAISKGNTEVAMVLIDRGADVNQQNGNGWTPLTLAIIKGNTEVAIALINKEADVNRQDGNGRTPLIWAIRNGHTEVAMALINKGADINQQDEDGWTPLIWAISNSMEELAIMLVEKGAKIENPYILSKACKNNMENLVKVLIDKGVNVNGLYSSPKDNSMPLYEAINTKNPQLIEMLIDAGANINGIINGFSLLEYACYKEDKEPALYLIELGACVRGLCGINALIDSARSEDDMSEVIIKLIEKGVDINAKNKDGYTAFIAACVNGNFKHAHILKQNGASRSGAYHIIQDGGDYLDEDYHKIDGFLTLMKLGETIPDDLREHPLVLEAKANLLKELPDEILLNCYNQEGEDETKDTESSSSEIKRPRNEGEDESKDCEQSNNDSIQNKRPRNENDDSMYPENVTSITMKMPENVTSITMKMMDLDINPPENYELTGYCSDSEESI
ncbi:MAG: ankyrin repeat domain-containing protein [Rickettsiaceae bacterium]|nr:ankyrin repeat domain-containing protein [Rickettsiaceae bacterium]